MLEKNYICETPIVYIFFNRLEKMEKGLNAIKKVKPTKMYLVSDGPRNDKEKEIVEKCRSFAENTIDWKCEIVKNYSDTNLGCRRRVFSGIEDAFKYEEQVIILEDDIIPTISFFAYMDYMLNRFKNESSVMQVSGGVLPMWSEKQNESFFLAKYCGIWGWGTWKRAWSMIDINMESWKNGNGKKKLRKELSLSEYLSISYDCDQVAYKDFDTWDYQWTYCKLINHGIGVVPSKKMICNVGFDQEATHTKNSNPSFEVEGEELSDWSLFDSEITRNKVYDEFYIKEVYGKSFLRLLYRKIKYFFRG